MEGASLDHGEIDVLSISFNKYVPAICCILRCMRSRDTGWVVKHLSRCKKLQVITREGVGHCFPMRTCSLCCQRQTVKSSTGLEQGFPLISRFPHSNTPIGMSRAVLQRCSRQQMSCKATSLPTSSILLAGQRIPMLTWHRIRASPQPQCPPLKGTSRLSVQAQQMLLISVPVCTRCSPYRRDAHWTTAAPICRLTLSWPTTHFLHTHRDRQQRLEQAIDQRRAQPTSWMVMCRWSSFWSQWLSKVAPGCQPEQLPPAPATSALMPPSARTQPIHTTPAGTCC